MIIDSFSAGAFQVHINDSLRQIQTLTQALAPQRVCVDIGAGDGLNQSNCLYLFMQGWQGLAIEAESQAFATLESFYRPHLPQVQLQQIRVTPLNICTLMQNAGIPAEFGFLSLDIDSYDFEILQAVLQNFRPTLICAEINEKIPPPLRFRVKYHPEHVYPGGHFYGMSLQSLQDLADQHDYDLLSLCFNNAFLVPRERKIGSPKSTAEVYAEGYLSGPLPEYNRNLHHLQTLSPESALSALHEHFASNAGRYQAGLSPE